MTIRSVAFTIGLSSAIAACGGGKKPDDKPDPTGRGSAVVDPTSSRPATAKKPIESKPLPALEPDATGATGKPIWQFAFGGFKDDVPRGLAVAPDGSTYVCGVFEGELFVGNQKYPVTDPKGSDAYLVKLDASGKVVWVKTFGGKRDDVAVAVAVRGDSVVVVGHFLDDLKIGEFTKKSAGSDDMFVAAFDTKGEAQWLWTGGGIDTDGLNAIAPTTDGGWIIGGSFTDGFDLGQTHLKAKGKTNGTDALLLKLKGGGDMEWVKTFGGNYDDTILHLAVDANDNVIVQGHLKDISDWGGKQLKAGGGSDNDVVLAKYDANGDHVWSQNFGNAFNDVAGGVAVDPSGAITMVGSFDKTISFGKDDSHTALGESDIFIARFSPAGVLEWAKAYGADREDQSFGVGVDKFGASVMSGYFTGGVDFGKGVVQSNTPNKDVVIMKHDAKGNVVWVKTFGDHDHDHGRGVAIDDKGNATVVGTYRFMLDAGAGSALDSMRLPDDKIPKMDTFVLRLEK